MKLRCRLFGHKDVAYGPEYEHGRVELQPDHYVPISWVCTERCGRCLQKVWWPA